MPEESSNAGGGRRGLEPAWPLGEARGRSEPAQPGQGRPARGAIRWLGTELRRLRLEQGISQRELTHRIGLSAHSNLGEYERGSRIPPSDIVIACERLFAVQPGYLQGLRRRALRERALLVTGQLVPEFSRES